jgi:hypothetical protein
MTLKRPFNYTRAGRGMALTRPFNPTRIGGGMTLLRDPSTLSKPLLGKVNNSPLPEAEKRGEALLQTKQKLQ